MSDTSGIGSAENYAEDYISMTVLADRILVYHINGKDISRDLESQLKKLGVNCVMQFKSPCG